jgi:hypothetical protein
MKSDRDACMHMHAWPTRQYKIEAVTHDWVVVAGSFRAWWDGPFVLWAAGASMCMPAVAIDRWREWVTLHPSLHDSSVTSCSECETVKEKSSSDNQILSIYSISIPWWLNTTDAQCWCVNGKKVQQQQASRPANGGMHWSLSVCVCERAPELGSWHCLAVHRMHCTHACWKSLNLRLRHPAIVSTRGDWAAAVEQDKLKGREFQSTSSLLCVVVYSLLLDDG